jgi:hypothetical protein
LGVFTSAVRKQKRGLMSASVCVAETLLIPSDRLTVVSCVMVLKAKAREGTTTGLLPLPPPSTQVSPNAYKPYCSEEASGTDLARIKRQKWTTTLKKQTLVRGPSL